MLVYLFEAAQLYYLYLGCPLNQSVHIVWIILLVLYFCIASTSLFKLSLIVYAVVNNVPSQKQNTCNNQEILIVYLAIGVYTLAMLVFLVLLIIKIVVGKTRTCSVCKKPVELADKAHYSVFSCCNFTLHTKCNPWKEKAKCPSCIKQCAQCNEDINRRVDDYYWHRKCLRRFHSKCLQSKKCPKCSPIPTEPERFSEIPIPPQRIMNSESILFCVICKQEIAEGQSTEDFSLDRCAQCTRKSRSEKSQQCSEKASCESQDPRKGRKGIVIEKVESSFFGSNKSDDSHISLNPHPQASSTASKKEGSKISRIYKKKKRTSQIQ